ncbi:MAG: rRNA maturation RNase YbeY [Nitrospira sp.]|nr:rRNA maturation RNase YbeY [Nitrospira sp.]MBH0181965.1 rRNA maturation RNase YbeY [Nitrospira sp.]MBH0184115.1 rRNA maturation RNase YbeY [Nitrospira sp.]
MVRVAELVLDAVGEQQSELSIELAGDRRMRRLNRLYRKKDRTTDVLAFPMREALAPHATRFPMNMLGDVVISVPQARRQAIEAGGQLDKEIVSLLVHGVLHLCGYDHERDEKEAARMHRRERQLLRVIGSAPRLVGHRTVKTERRL